MGKGSLAGVLPKSNLFLCKRDVTIGVRGEAGIAKIIPKSWARKTGLPTEKKLSEGTDKGIKKKPPVRQSWN